MAHHIKAEWFTIFRKSYHKVIINKMQCVDIFPYKSEPCWWFTTSLRQREVKFLKKAGNLLLNKLTILEVKCSGEKRPAAAFARERK